jgi:hypothetical protein
MAFAIGLATAIGPIGDAKAATECGLSTTKPEAVVQLGLSARDTLPMAITSGRPVP